MDTINIVLDRVHALENMNEELTKMDKASVEVGIGRKPNQMQNMKYAHH